MKRRKKDQEKISNQIKNKIILKNKKKNKDHVVKAPEKFIKEYRSAQKSYAHYKLKVLSLLSQNIHNAHFNIDGKAAVEGFNKLLLVIRIRGVKDISTQQKLILNKLKLRNVNTAVFLQATEANLRLLNRI
jgi:large subunit ribosomal protein L7e